MVQFMLKLGVATIPVILIYGAIGFIVMFALAVLGIIVGAQ